MKTWLLLVLMAPTFAWAWGKRGHQIVGETAALLVSDEPHAGFMRGRSFDFGYYANVPDFIWKRPATYEMERNQHFMDLEIFERAFAKHPDAVKGDPYALPRAEFEAKFPEVPVNAGRAFWRVRELEARVTDYTKQLRALKALSGKERQALQEKWLVTAGVMAHYVGDLSQPLHVSENYDGEKTGQKGIHSYFEDEMVDELYPRLSGRVWERASAAWPEFKKHNASKSTLELLEQLAKSSRDAVKTLLEIDKGAKRAASAKNGERFERLIEERLAEGAMTLAEIYRRQLGWSFDGKKFYFFAGEPEYIQPGK